jgi:hypothetical protein
VLDTYSRALPHTFREVVRAEGTAVTLAITGDAGGAWTLMRERGAWRLYAGSAGHPASRISLQRAPSALPRCASAMLPA